MAGNLDAGAGGRGTATRSQKLHEVREGAPSSAKPRDGSTRSQQVSELKVPAESVIMRGDGELDSCRRRRRLPGRIRFQPEIVIALHLFDVVRDVALLNLDPILEAQQSVAWDAPQCSTRPDREAKSAIDRSSCAGGE